MRDDYLGAMTLQFVEDDGGRKAAGFSKAITGDCVTRAIAIAVQIPYLSACQLVNTHGTFERSSKNRKGKRSTVDTGVYKPTIRRIMANLGWTWEPTMGIGTGCYVHLRPGELPNGRLVIQLSRHLTTVIDQVIHDTYDPSREGTRCVYGFWYQKAG